MSLSLRTLALLAVLAGVTALATALTAQFGFGLRPCILCLVQRGPFALAALLGLAALSPRLGESLRARLILLAGLAFLVNTGVAAYHVGVERHWWASPGCSSNTETRISFDDLAAQMSKPVEVRCDKPEWQWHGLTMAGLNVPYSGGLAVIVLLGLRRRRI